ncbi:MAG: adenine phosphoribosyltransferase [Alyxoria varia]|nr:MAG: adenine phosphoribosyltransferase [Alyxoria varia]
MSGQPVSIGLHPPHGHPENDISGSTQASDKPSTSSHPPSVKPDPTIEPTTADAVSHSTTQTHNQLPNASTQGAIATAHPSPSAKLTSLKVTLRSALRQFPDFPSPGILFEDIFPIFADPHTHEALLSGLELQVLSTFGEARKPDVILGLEARGFLFGPGLALRLGAAFAPVRKKGKLPGETVTTGFKKEYGEDFFQIQKDAMKEGQKVLVVDDIIATGGSAAAAGSLVKQSGGSLLGYLFILELDFLKGREKLDAPVHTLLSGQEKSHASAP